MRTKVYPCRFPGGCEWTAKAPAPRGRHESQSHGMKNGALSPKPTPEEYGVREEYQLEEARMSKLMDKLKGPMIGPLSSGSFRLPVELESPAKLNGHMSPADHVRAALADLKAQRAIVTANCLALEGALSVLDPDEAL